MNIDTVIQGDCLEVLKTLPDESINCCVTSPPYYGLRDYGTGKWIGGDPNCPHRRISKFSEHTITGHAQEELAGNVGDAIYKKICPLCGAVREDKQIGLEETPEEYIEKLTRVFREVRRVLKDDGTLWLNIGDSYATGGGRSERKQSPNPGVGANNEMAQNSVPFVGTPEGCKGKDLIGIPWMLAFALRADGWYLRQDIIWQKPNPMPESVKDRCTKSHEYIFLLSKKPKYYFDHEAIQEDVAEATIKRLSQDIDSQEGSYTPSKGNGKMKAVGHLGSKYKNSGQEASVRQGMSKERGTGIVALRKKLPSQLREFVDDWSDSFRMIDQGLTEVTYESDAIDKNSDGKRNKRDVWSVATQAVKEAHFATFPEKLIEPCILAGCPVGGVVLDPFFGSGTTGRVATKLNRHYVGIELNPEYIEISSRRTNNIQMTMEGLV